MSPAVIRLTPGEPLADPRLALALVRDYLVWDGHVAGERRVDLHPLVLPPEVHVAAVHAAEAVARGIDAVAARAHEDPRERALYALARDVAAVARASHLAGDRSTLARVDLLLGADGVFRACEVNADCPGGHNEALGLPRLAREAGFTAALDPTFVVDALARRIEELAAGGAVALLYATAYAEDLQICALLQRVLASRGVRALLAPPTAPRMGPHGLTVGGEVVRVLYRYFPLEYMEGQTNLEEIGQAIAAGQVRTVSSCASIYAQSKLAFARAWASDAPEPPALQAARPHLPPTFELWRVPRARLLAERGSWVIKSAFGRVGDEVFVGALIDERGWRTIVDLARGRAEAWIAQHFIPQRTIATPWGQRYLTLGAYVLDGSFVGYFARVTPESHVSHGALCLPVFVARPAAGAAPGPRAALEPAA